jgi:FkbH-like protein
MSNSVKLSTADKRVIKSIVWDLDNTLWDGILLEDGDVRLREGVRDLIKTMDERGILQSIASKNDHSVAMAKLRDLGLEEYFLYPQINWSSKASSIKTIAQSLNIGLDSIAFIDDQAFERDEVSFSIPEVMCINAAEMSRIPGMAEFNPRFVTLDSKNRRGMYISDQMRKQVEDAFVGPKEEFLASLRMSFTISRCREEDLKRAEELTVRTNQLNTTGRTYSYDELDYFRDSREHLLLISSLEDVYGSYGKVGLALVELAETHMMIKLLLMSCRVMSRGVGTILMTHLLNLAKSSEIPLRAEFLPNDRNRLMYITYKFAGFKEIGKVGDLILFENDLSFIQPFPDYVELHILD